MKRKTLALLTLLFLLCLYFIGALMFYPNIKPIIGIVFISASISMFTHLWDKIKEAMKE